MFSYPTGPNATQAPPRPCPSCGSSRVASSTYRYDPRRGITISSQGRPPGFWGLLTWVVSTFLLNGVLPYFFGGRFGVVSAIPFWVPVALAVGVMLTVSVVQEWRQTRAVRVDSYTCGACGHEWQLRDGRPVAGKRA